MLSKIMRSVSDFWDSKIPEDVDEKINTFKDKCNDWGYSDWGYSLDWLKRETAVSNLLRKKYFRLDEIGLENIPTDKPFMLIGNHSGQMAYDGMLICTSLLMEMDPPIFIHAMVGSFFASSPVYSILMPRLGQISGTPENCVKLLEEGHPVLIFPEGEKGGGKTIFDRYKLMNFGMGFMQIALQCKVPIIPFGFIGGEEMVPSFSRMEAVGKMVGMPYVPLAPAGPLPLPTKCSVYFGKPLVFDTDPLDDDGVKANVDKVKLEIRQLIDEGLENRTSIF